MATQREIENLEEKAKLTEVAESDQLRRTIADVYTFVRSAEINKTVSGFSLDHYIDEAKRRLKGGRTLRSASDPGRGVGTRASRKDILDKLEIDCREALAKAKETAQRVDEEQQE